MFYSLLRRRLFTPATTIHRLEINAAHHHRHFASTRSIVFPRLQTTARMSTTTTTTQIATPPTTTTTTLRTPPQVTAENVFSLFPEVRPGLLGADLAPNHTPCHPTTTNNNNNATTTSSSSHDLSGYDAEQIRLMDELCIVLSPNDEILGSATKKYTHLMTNINQGLLHRAFSVFLFHPETKKLLLQQRASEKITFPDMWTNTCCSHPLAHPAETGTSGDLVSSVDGAKRAAIRKLDHELGIPSSKLPVDGFRFLTRIHYLAPCDAAGTGHEGKWGEHEIDYILFIEADPGQLDAVNENEVQDVRWVSETELRQMFRDVESKTGVDAGLKYTPWFRLICEGMLFEWWGGLRDGKLDQYVGEKMIRRMF